MITILLATYNGADFLPEQLASLQRQTHRDWRLLVRDDGSTDGTPDVLARAAAEDCRIECVTDTLGRLGVIGNFGALIERAVRAGAEAVAFCDQDDVWHPEKLAALHTALNQSEGPADQPRIACCDLAVVDHVGHPRASSFWQLNRTSPPKQSPLASLLLKNFAPGCSMLLNRAALELCHPLPSGIVMHDWWAMLVAASVGRILAVPTPLVDYRQHGSNTIGATTLLHKLNPLGRDFSQQWARSRRGIQGRLAQAEQLTLRLAERDLLANCHERPALEAFQHTLGSGGWQRLAKLLRYRWPQEMRQFDRSLFTLRVLLANPRANSAA